MKAFLVLFLVFFSCSKLFANNCPILFKNERIVSFKKGSNNNELFLVYHDNNTKPALTRKIYGEAKQRDNDIMGFYLIHRILNSRPAQFRDIKIVTVLNIKDKRTLDLEYKEGVSLDLLLERKNIQKLEANEARRYIELSENKELQKPITIQERQILENDKLIIKAKNDYLNFLETFFKNIQEQALTESFQKLEVIFEHRNTNNAQISIRYRPQNADRDYFLFLKNDNVLVDLSGKLTIIDPH